VLLPLVPRRLLLLVQPLALWLVVSPLWLVVVAQPPPLPPPPLLLLATQLTCPAHAHATSSWVADSALNQYPLTLRRARHYAQIISYRFALCGMRMATTTRPKVLPPPITSMVSTKRCAVAVSPALPTRPTPHDRYLPTPWNPTLPLLTRTSCMY
jgi:hypothetical protein